MFLGQMTVEDCVSMERHGTELTCYDMFLGAKIDRASRRSPVMIDK